MQSNKDPIFHLYTINGVENAAHPSSPAGGGGPGNFRSVGPLGVNPLSHLSLPDPHAPAVRYFSPRKMTAMVSKVSFNIEDIPKIMKANGWSNGAKLMESWFKRPAKILPDYDTPDESTIKMSWVLGFSRAKTEYDKFMGEKIWQNDAAKNQIEIMLRKKGLLNSNAFPITFGNLSAHLRPALVDNDHINSRPATPTWAGMLNKLDDMTAALGNFTFKLLVGGTIDADKSGHKVNIQKWESIYEIPMIFRENSIWGIGTKLTIQQVQ